MKYFLYSILLSLTVTSFLSMDAMKISDICNAQNEDAIVSPLFTSSESNQSTNEVNEIIVRETMTSVSHDSNNKVQHVEPAKFYRVASLKNMNICPICRTKKRRPYQHFVWEHTGCKTCCKVFYLQEDLLAHIRKVHDTASKQEVIAELIKKIKEKQKENGEKVIQTNAIIWEPYEGMQLAVASLDGGILPIHKKDQRHVEKRQRCSQVHTNAQESQVSKPKTNEKSKFNCKRCQREISAKHNLDRHVADIHKECLTCNSPFDSLSLLISHFREEHPQKESIIMRLEGNLLRSLLEE